LEADKLWFYPGMVVLVSWAIIARSGKGLHGLEIATGIALLAAAAAGIGGQRALTALYQYTIGRSGSGPGGGASSAQRSTSFGDLGEIKQSTEILWRIIPEQGRPPAYLRVASYNRWESPNWLALLPKDAGNETADFQPPNFQNDPFKPDDERAGYYLCPPVVPSPEVAISPSLPRFRLRGEVKTSGQFGLLPLPSNSASLQEFIFERLERSSFGTFRIEPSQPMCDARVLWDESFATEKPPWISVIRRNQRNLEVSPDLEVPEREAAVISSLATELGLHGGTAEEKIARIRRYFSDNFRYTRYNSVPERLHKWAERDKGVRRYVSEVERPTYLGVFLEHTKAGHCEFFATAAALLLREAGVPTRYVSGFAVAERNPKLKEFIIRGTHAHAWCRAWDEENHRWLDVDVTPADWMSLETPRPVAFQDLRDRLQLLKEDLLVWRDKPGHMLLITIILIAPIGVGLVFVGRSLWRSRKVLEEDRKQKSPTKTPQTALASLEKPVRKILGERPAGKPLGTWLMPLAARLQSPEVLSRALALHHRLRFDPGEDSPTLATELQALVADIRRQLRSR
jgi:protein-glutamine gamma-glutamyltransferase